MDNVFFRSYISHSYNYILNATQRKINSRRKWLAGWRSWRARSQFPKERHEILFLVVRRNIWCDLLVVHEEKKISSIVMIQSSHSSKHWCVNRFWYFGKLMNLVYRSLISTSNIFICWYLWTSPLCIPYLGRGGSYTAP